MINTYIKYTLLFFISVFAQVLIFDNLYLVGYVNTFIYILFILMLPLETNKFLVLFLAFILGFSVDMFNSTPGVNASATVLMAYLRPFFLDIFSPRDGYEANKFPTVDNYGFYWFFRYSLSLILIHHIFLFFVETFSFAHFFYTVSKIILSTISTFVFVFLGHLFFPNK